MTMPVKDAPFLEERTAAVMESVFNDPIVKKALEQAVPQEIFTIEEQIEICEVPAPPMKEQTRAAMIAEKINSYGLEASNLLILSGTSSPAEKVRIRTVPSALSARIWIIALGKERTLRFAAKTADCLRPVFPTHPVHWPACSKLFEWSSTTTSRQRERCFSLPRSGRRQKGTCAA